MKKKLRISKQNENQSEGDVIQKKIKKRKRQSDFPYTTEEEEFPLIIEQKKKTISHLQDDDLDKDMHSNISCEKKLKNEDKTINLTTTKRTTFQFNAALSPNSLSLLSLYAVNRRLQLQQRRTSLYHHKTKIRVFNGCLYNQHQSVSFPPGALPEHTQVWARLTDDMPHQSEELHKAIYPWHPAKILYARPANGFCLGFIHHQGQVENINDYLVEWVLGPLHQRQQQQQKESSYTTTTTTTPITTRAQSNPTHNEGSRTRTPSPSHLISNGGKDKKYEETTSTTSTTTVAAAAAAATGNNALPHLRETKEKRSPKLDAQSEFKKEIKKCVLVPTLGLDDFPIDSPMVGPSSPNVVAEQQQQQQQQYDEYLLTPSPRNKSTEKFSPERLDCPKWFPSMDESLSLDGNSIVSCSPWQYDYYVHYKGYNRRYDRWCSLNELLPLILNPKDKTFSLKGMMKQIVSTLCAINYKLISKYDKNGTLIKKSTSNHVEDILIMTSLKILFSLYFDEALSQDFESQSTRTATPETGSLNKKDFFFASEHLNELKQQQQQQQLEFDHETCPPKKRSFNDIIVYSLQLFQSFKMKNDPTADDAENINNNYLNFQLSQNLDIAKIWWSLIVLSYYQIDLLELQISLYSNAKKKKKSGSTSNYSLGSNPILLNACPSDHVLRALDGKCGISMDYLNCISSTFESKWNKIINLNINSITSINQLNDLGHLISIADVFDPSTASTPSNSSVSVIESGATIDSYYTKIDLKNVEEMNGIPSLLLQKLIHLILQISGHQHLKTTVVKDEKTNENCIIKNMTGINCIDDVESDVGEHEGLDEESIEAHESATKIRTIEFIQMNNFRLPTWYYSPFPFFVHPTACLYICAGCLGYFKLESELKIHEQRCHRFTPPGDEIYRDGRLSFFEVDGEIEWAYCENLSLLAKLFLDHKTLQYSVTPFFYYVLIEWDDDDSLLSNTNSIYLKEAGLTPARNNRMVGYFSKEKESSMGYNLACILTLPQHQRKGYGKFFIHFSYALSKIERKVGTPERPLSDLGRISYLQYWKSILSEFLLTSAKTPPACICFYSDVADRLSSGLCTVKCPKFKNDQLKKYLASNDQKIPSMGQLGLTVEDISHFTSIKKDDIILTLKEMGLYKDVSPSTTESVILYDDEKLSAIRVKCGTSPPAILPENFVWATHSSHQYMMTPSGVNSPVNDHFDSVQNFDHKILNGLYHFPNATSCRHVL